MQNLVEKSMIISESTKYFRFLDENQPNLDEQVIKNGVQKILVKNPRSIIWIPYLIFCSIKNGRNVIGHHWSTND